jgi:hypothetical protein
MNMSERYIEKIRHNVRKAIEMEKSKPITSKYCNRAEQIDDFQRALGCSKRVAERVRAIMIADGYHNDLYLETYGFNKTTA